MELKYWQRALFINVGTPVTIRLEVSPNAPAIKGKAKVVWWKKTEPELAAYFLGIVFHDLRWRQRFQLKKLVKRLSKEASQSRI